MRPGLAAFIFGLLRAPSLWAQDQKPAPRPPQQSRPAPQPKQPPPPLSAEDAELCRDLDLLERFELVKNLDLFEPDPKSP